VIPEKRLAPALEAIRDRGWRGGYIRTHRAFVRLRLHPERIVETVSLAGLGVLGWIAALPFVAHVWARIFAFWAKELGLNSEVTLVPQVWGGHVRYSLPTFGLAAGPATGEAWWITAAVTVAAFAGSFLFGEEALPWRYMVRGFCLLQATALGYFALASARFPHDLPTYTVSMLQFSSILIGLIPPLYAFTFYILNFTLRQKIFLTIVTMLHLTVFVPHQYLLHVYVLHSSVLLMPLLYFVFGPFLDILAFIGFYSWGMSWKASEEFEI
jgi:hypothetical protein